MKLPDSWFRAVPVFDDEHLVSCAGLVPVIGLAEQTGLAELIEQRVRFKASKVASAGVNPAGKLTAIAGRDGSRGGLHRRSRRNPRWRDAPIVRGVYAPGNAGPVPARVHPRPHPAAGLGAAGAPGHLIEATDLLPGIAEQVFVDVDSLLRPVYGHAKQGASYVHTKIAGKQVLRQGLSPLATTLSTPTGAPVLAGLRLRAGKAGSGKGAATMVAEAVRVARQAAPPVRS